jgi:hypothetical protein
MVAILSFGRGLDMDESQAMKMGLKMVYRRRTGEKAGMILLVGW